MPNRRGAARARETLPWWLSAGDEQCAHCGQLYAREVEIRCARCDEGCCPHCIVRVRTEQVCAGCRER